jgi:hypothetical protein
MATIWDADVLIWAASQIVEAETAACQRHASSASRPTSCSALSAARDGSATTSCSRARSPACNPPSSAPRSARASIGAASSSPGSTSGRNATRDGPRRGHGVRAARLVLSRRHRPLARARPSIRPISELTGGIERWLYRVARKHAGRQPAGGRFESAPPSRQERGSLARVSDFALDIRRIVARQPLPGYELMIEIDARAVVILHMQPVDSVWISPSAHGTSGANPIGTSGAAGTVLWAHQGELFPVGSTAKPPPNVPNPDSNFLVVGGSARCGSRAGAKRGARP